MFYVAADQSHIEIMLLIVIVCSTVNFASLVKTIKHFQTLQVQTVYMKQNQSAKMDLVL